MEYLLKDATFKVRGLTRNPQSERAKALRLQGVDVVYAEFNNRLSLEEAFKGCYAAFLVTNWWEHFNADIEVEQGRALCDACRSSGVKHVVWSSLEDTRDTLSGKSKPLDNAGRTVPHCDGKAEISEYMLRAGAPSTVFITSSYMENFIDILKPRKLREDHYVYINNMPRDTVLPLHPVSEIGGAVLKILKQGPGVWGGKTVGWCTDQVSWGEICSLLSEVLGMKVEHVYLPDEDFLALMQQVVPQGADEMVNMFMSFREGEEAGRKLRDLDQSRALYLGTNMRTWVAGHKDELLQAMNG